MFRYKGNIEQAIITELNYIEHGGNLLLLIKLFNYDKLEEYFIDKNIYLLANSNVMDYTHTNGNNLKERISYSILNMENGLWTLEDNQITMYVGNETFDKLKADSLGVRVHELNYPGGNMIVLKDDFSCLLILNIHTDIDYVYLFNRLYSFISNKLNCYIDNNDVMFNDKKIIGVSGFSVNNMNVFGVVASFVDSTYYIEQLCTPSIKKLGIIPQDKLTKRELELEICSWVGLSI